MSKGSYWRRYHTKLQTDHTPLLAAVADCYGHFAMRDGEIDLDELNSTLKRVVAKFRRGDYGRMLKTCLVKDGNFAKFKYAVNSPEGDRDVWLEALIPTMCHRSAEVSVSFPGRRILLNERSEHVNVTNYEEGGKDIPWQCKAPSDSKEGIIEVYGSLRGRRGQEEKRVREAKVSVSDILENPLLVEVVLGHLVGGAVAQA